MARIVKSLATIHSALIVLGLAAGSTIVLRSQELPRRVLQFKPETAIAHQLQPGDSFVTIERDWGSHPGLGPSVGTPDTAAFVGLAMIAAEAVVLIDVEAVHPRLTENSSWIHTEVIGRVAEVLYAGQRTELTKAPRLPRGRVISIDYPWGGEARIYDIRVRAGSPLVLEEGRRYLAFLSRNWAEPWHLTHTLLGVEHGKLVDSVKDTRRPGVRDELAGLPLSQVKKLVREIGARFDAEMRSLVP